MEIIAYYNAIQAVVYILQITQSQTTWGGSRPKINVPT